MSRAIAVASGTADVQAHTGAATLVGVTARESHAITPAATSIVLRNGTTATDPIVAIIELATNQSVHVPLPAVDCPGGIFVDRDGTGTTELVLYIL